MAKRTTGVGNNKQSRSHKTKKRLAVKMAKKEASKIKLKNKRKKK